MQLRRTTVLSGTVLAALAGLVGTAHEVRRRLTGVATERDSLDRQAMVLSSAVREMTTLHRSDEVIAAGVRLAADLISPSAAGGRRALYFVVEGDVARIVAQSDEVGPSVDTLVALADHPALAEVVKTLRPVHTTFRPEALGESARDAMESMQITHGAAVPIMVEGNLHGVLAVGGRGEPISEFDRLVDLAGVIELALTNAVVNEELERQATLDPLTGCANRRGLLLAAQLLSNRQPFSVVAADLDGLKELNDRLGHHAGDKALWRFADIVRGLMRTGDVLARVGSDEFIILMNNTDERGAGALAERIAARAAVERGATSR